MFLSVKERLQTNNKIKKERKNAMDHWKYCYDYKQTFTNESNFRNNLSRADRLYNQSNQTLFLREGILNLFLCLGNFD